MRFNVYGPYDIGVDEDYKNWIDKKDIDSFWENIRRKGRDKYDLPDACGVYLFGMRGEQGRRGRPGQTLPWYVGKAESQTFKEECFNGGHGTPFLYLLARVEKDDTHSLPAKGKSYWGVDFVEGMFIQMSLRANPQLVNSSKTKMERGISIRGLLNTGKDKSSSVESVDELKGMFGINL